VILLKTVVTVSTVQGDLYENFPPYNYQEDYQPRQVPNQQQSYQQQPYQQQSYQSYQQGGGGYLNNDFGSNFGNGLVDLPDPNVPRTIRVLIPQVGDHEFSRQRHIMRQILPKFQPYPVHVNVEQPVQIPVYRVVPQIIEKPVPYTVEKVGNRQKPKRHEVSNVSGVLSAISL
jgi:hypothetical protein